jgi:hypothetical protein
MIECPLDASQLEPRCRLGKKECFSCDAPPLSTGLSPGDLRRKRQKELVDHFCGDSLSEDGRPSFVQKQAYPELVGEKSSDIIAKLPIALDCTGSIAHQAARLDPFALEVHGGTEWRAAKVMR